VPNDCHIHFFSEQFFATLGRQHPPGSQQSAADIVAALGWDPPGSPEHLADRWVKELDRAGVARAALMASVPGDEESVARAVAQHPSRIVGFFMLDPTAPDAAPRTEHALDQQGLRGICLFPAMQRYSLHDPRVRDIVQLAAAHAGTAVFVHCGALSVGVRKKLGLPSRFDVRLGNPLDLAGPDRLLFGTDSSFFPRGWNRLVYDAQVSALDALGVDESVRHRIFAGNFDRLFPA
jgi:predicted TIM-barrel fold metal-dependent hydrolase